MRKGDIVLLSDKEFPANVYPWLLLHEKEIGVEFTATTASGWPDEERLLERLRDPRVRVLAISFVQFSIGYRANLKRLGNACPKTPSGSGEQSDVLAKIPAKTEIEDEIVLS